MSRKTDASKKLSFAHYTHYIPYHFVYLGMCMKHNHICLIYIRIYTCNLFIETFKWNYYDIAHKIFYIYFNDVLNNAVINVVLCGKLRVRKSQCS